MISTTAVHALNAGLALAERPGVFQGAAAIAAKIQAPKNYLGKLLQTLAAAGIVYSQKGLGGGFQLAKPPEEITLYDVVQPIDDVEKWSRCFMGQKKCSEESPCALHAQWASVREAYFAMLKESTLADIVAGGQLPFPAS